ncbi:lytic transglycosylase domain-containing protein [Oleiagrimonas sp.]|jgi:soluble lytic murein transglycosylase-like protein|uniref:lytic transglycosylase domain-containing protein n=1 Tax=Oleiagrimonas sp. TaxID=2010330 RepID=UPI002618665E|nr:lytic transglycosylase domain-containing protein [Oleiagrimonas sp.]MDA3914512.1 lytic transglycosylase domain-containing protein [Oleiagrimonas sp.]
MLTHTWRMLKAARHGGSGHHRARFLPSKTSSLLQLAALCAFALTLVPASPTRATTLYSCVGKSGETAFTSDRAGFHKCRRIHVDALPVMHTPKLALPASAASVKHAASSVSPAASVVATAAHRGEVWQYRQRPAAEVPAVPKGMDGRNARVLRGSVYRIRHADGSIEYTNVSPHGALARGAQTKTLFTYMATCVACNLHSTIHWADVPLRLDAYAGAIRAAAARYAVQPSLLRAVIHAESGYNPRAMSAKGAQGLMQLMPSTAASMGVSNAFDPADNIRGGARYLAQLLKTFHGDERLAEAAYNAGPDAVRKFGGVPPFAETRIYVKRVSLLHKRYRKALRRADALASGGGNHAD